MDVVILRYASALDHIKITDERESNQQLQVKTNIINMSPAATYEPDERSKGVRMKQRSTQTSKYQHVDSVIHILKHSLQPSTNKTSSKQS